MPFMPSSRRSLGNRGSSRLYALERLNLSGNRVADVGPLGELPGLRVLVLDGNALTDVGPLTHMTGLENLGLAGNGIADVTPLQDLPALRRLDLGANSVRDVSPLGDIGSLVWLVLPGPHPIIVKPLIFTAVALTILAAPESTAQELPPEVQVDRLLVQAEREIKDGEHWSAVATFERIRALSEEHGLQTGEFWFRQAGVVQGAGLHEHAVEAATRYLQEAGRDGEHYRAALEILDAAEVALAEARQAVARARAAAEREATARAEVIAAAVPEMVVIPAGTFRMGCLARRGWGPEKPVREVRVGSFALAKYELTFVQWDVCAEHGPCRSVMDEENWGRGDRPVVNVSWNDAQSFVGWLSRETGESYRLPSEAE